jgi:hypothetical protein
MTSYKIIKSPYGENTSVERDVNGIKCAIPFDPANTDYQEYLKWLAESPDNIPLPADGDSNGI